MSIEEAAAHFEIRGKLLQIDPIKTGHINETFKSTWKTPEGGEISFIHQRVNHHVFPDVPALMRNMEKVTSYLKSKQPYPGKPEQALELRKSDQHELFWRSSSGEFWRTFAWIPESEGFEICPDDEHAYSVGAAFGSFLKDLSDLPSKALVDPIPFFQNVPRRLSALRSAIERDPRGRRSEARDLIDFIDSRSETIKIIEDALSKRLIPERVVHADPKVSNVLFRRGTTTVVAIVDLDTCMTGTSLFEVGDMLRSAGVSCAEDEEDLTKVKINTRIAAQLLRGYLSHTTGILTDTERKLLPRSPQVIALSLGMRFLTDHLEGDHYFRIHYEGQNLRRARTQLAIAKRFEECEADLVTVLTEFD